MTTRLATRSGYATCLTTGTGFRHVFGYVALSWPVPDAASVGGDVNHLGIGRGDSDAMAHLKLYPRRRFQAARHRPSATPRQSKPQAESSACRFGCQLYAPSYSVLKR